MNSGIATFKRLLDDAENIVFFTGAGVSTESGIPDFRSKGTGIWNKISPIEFQDFISSEDTRKESWRRKFSGSGRHSKPTPNRGHRAIAHLIDLGKASIVITQNVDNLHQDSGVPDEKVLELHGNAQFAACLTCNHRYELIELRAQFNEIGTIKPCTICGGIIKTATISFGQQLPQQTLFHAELASQRCDLFIVVGSSLIVYPAAALPQLASQSGAQLVILNREATPLDDIADVVVNDEIGPTLGDLVGVN